MEVPTYSTSEQDYTFFSNLHNTYFGIDFFLTDKRLLQRAVEACIHNIAWSDHLPISLDIVDDQLDVNKLLWRNNPYILSNPHFRKQISDKLNEFFLFNNDGSSSVSNVWCTHKNFIGGILIQLASREKSRRSHSFSTLLKEIANLESLHKCTHLQSTQTQLRALRDVLKTNLIANQDTFFFFTFKVFYWVLTIRRTRTM